MNGGGLMIYARDVMPSKKLAKHNPSEDIEAAFTELNFWKCKWLLWTKYCSSFQNHDYVFDNVDKDLDVYSTYKRVAPA